jgi:hypothetical protein
MPAHPGADVETPMLSDLLVKHDKPNDRQVLITEVTRMTNGLVCVAGIDLATGKMRRPLTEDGSNWDEATWVEKNYLRVGNIVGLTPAAAAAAPHYPHATEDFRCSYVTPLAVASPAQLYQACVETADPDLDTLFAGQLVTGKYVDDGTKCRSLGCLLVDAARLQVSVPFDKVQVSWQDPPGVWHNLSVTEVAIRTPEPVIGMSLLNQRLAGVTGNVALRLGLARGWAGPQGSHNPKRCYLQLNGLIVPA